jgi:cytochrome c-type biogenesis protein CcmF
VVMIAVAFAASSSYSTQREVRLAPGDTAHIAGHRITYLGTQDSVEKASFKKKARLRIDGGQIYAPAIQRFPNATQQVGTPSVKSTLTEDIYLAVLELPRTPGGTIQLRLLVEPLVIWLWIGGGVIVFGSLLAAFPGRRRNPIEAVSAPVAGGRPAAGPPPPEREPEPEPAGVA